MSRLINNFKVKVKVKFEIYLEYDRVFYGVSEMELINLMPLLIIWSD